MNRLFKMLLLLVASGLILSSCGGETPMQVSDAERDTAPQVVEADLAELVNGNSDFAFRLYQALRQEDGNLFYSPYSISLALAMTYAGARGATESEMAEAMSYLLAQEGLHPAFNGLDLELAKRGEGAEGKDSQGFRLNIVNALWGQEGYEFQLEFLDLLATNYGAGMRLLDYVGAPEQARVTINDWVSEQTEGRIEDLIPQGMIDALTRLVLTNAIYFNAAWAEPFEEKWTKDGPFYLLDGSEITVPMMLQSSSFPYAQGEGYQAIELPYDGHELSMVILLPAMGKMGEFEASLSSERVDAILADLAHNQVMLKLPRFGFESQFGLKDALATLGMPTAFTEDADFSGMTGKPELFIADVVHKAFVSVDEAGTEAAAATAVIMSLTSAQADPSEMTVDHPFLFFIRDRKTGTILFVGRVVDPSV
jgi:serpin B